VPLIITKTLNLHSRLDFRRACCQKRPLLMQMNLQNGRATTLADPLRQGCRRGAYMDRIHGVSALLSLVPFATDSPSRLVISGALPAGLWRPSCDDHRVTTSLSSSARLGLVFHSKMYGGASLADTYRSLLVRGCAQAKPAERHTSYMRFKNTCNWHKPTIQMNTQNGRRITKADPLRQGCRRGAYRDCIHGVSAV